MLLFTPRQIFIMKIVWLPNIEIELLTFFDKNTKKFSWAVYVKGFNLNNHPLLGEKIPSSKWWHQIKVAFGQKRPPPVLKGLITSCLFWNIFFSWLLFQHFNFIIRKSFLVLLWKCKENVRKVAKKKKHSSLNNFLLSKSWSNCDFWPWASIF